MKSKGLQFGIVERIQLFFMCRTKEHKEAKKRWEEEDKDLPKIELKDIGLLQELRPLLTKERGEEIFGKEKYAED